MSDSETYYAKSIDADPKVAENYVELSTMLLRLGKIDKAIQVTQRSIKSLATPFPITYKCLGDLYRAKGNISDAHKSYKTSVKRSDDEDVEIAIEDIEQTAALIGDELKTDLPTDPKEKPEKIDHVPGQMVANIQREYFVKILSGEKKIEYRESTEYWQKRIMNAGRPPFYFRIINGMSKTAPELTIVVERVIKDIWNGNYELHLGKVIDVKNWDANGVTNGE